MNIFARRLLAALIILSAFATAPAIQASNTYAAVAFSPSTGRYGYGNGYDSQAGAVRRARQECSVADARTKWCRNAWVALAVSTKKGGYGWAWGTTAAEARAAARRACLRYNADARIVVCISSSR